VRFALAIAADPELLVLDGGVHAGVDPGRLAKLAAALGAAPTYFAPRLAW